MITLRQHPDHTRLLPKYVSEDGRVVIHRYGSLPSCQTWVAFVDGVKVASCRTREKAKRRAEEAIRSSADHLTDAHDVS